MLAEIRQMGSNFTQAVAGLESRLGALEKTLQEVCCETDGLKSEVEMYRARADSCEQVEALATGLQQAKLSLERQIAELRAGLRKAQAALAAAEPAAARVPGLEAELRVAREEGAAADDEAETCKGNQLKQKNAKA